jgi:hypothetical protein
VRGYRIELGEIESVLEQSDLVNQAVVLARKDNENSNSIISYYIPKWQEFKKRERDLYDVQVSNWKEIYETEYSKDKINTDEEFDIGIWNDSFTGEPIAEVQMREWVQDITDEILSEAMPLWIIIVIFGRELLITIIRSVAANRGVVIPAGKSGKLKAVFQNIFVGTALAWLAINSAAINQGWYGMQSWTYWTWFHGFVFMTSLIIAVFLTVYSLIVYLWQWRSLMPDA